MSDTDWSASSSSELLIRLSDGARVEAPPEWCPAFIALPVAADELHRISLLRGDQPLPLVVRSREGKLVVEVEWPRSGPGNYELRCPEKGLAWRLKVDSRKISPASMERLVEDLQFRLLASLGLALQRMGGLTGVKLLPPDRSTLAGEVQRMTRAVETLTQILPAIGREPHGMLATHGLMVPSQRARRPTIGGLARAFRQGGNLQADGRLSRIEDSRVEMSLDVVENRLVRAVTDQVGWRLRRLVPLAATASLMETYRNALRCVPFLSAIPPLTGPPRAVTMVMLKRPAYRRALKLLQELRQEPALELREPGLDAPLDNLPRLYERWGLLQVLVALCELAEEAGFRVIRENLVHLERGQPFFQVLRDGRPAVMLENDMGVSLEAIPQRYYFQGGRDLRSMSYPQKPDLAIERRATGEGVRVTLFDPKYKLYSEKETPQKVDVDMMHAYRDAIRDREGRAVVQRASILYPGQTIRFGPGVEAIRAVPGEDCRVDLTEALESILR